MRGETEIALKVGAVVNRHKMAKHFDLVITQTSLSFHRKAAAIAAEEALDGIYIVRTNLPKALNDTAAVGAYKSLARVERAFLSLKTVDITMRSSAIVSGRKDWDANMGLAICQPSWGV